jgi:hypothetical protein
MPSILNDSFAWMPFGTRRQTVGTSRLERTAGIAREPFCR